MERQAIVQILDLKPEAEVPDHFTDAPDWHQDKEWKRWSLAFDLSDGDSGAEAGVPVGLVTVTRGFRVRLSQAVRDSPGWSGASDNDVDRAIATHIRGLDVQLGVDEKGGMQFLSVNLFFPRTVPAPVSAKVEAQV